MRTVIAKPDVALLGVAINADTMASKAEAVIGTSNMSAPSAENTDGDIRSEEKSPQNAPYNPREGLAPWRWAVILGLCIVVTLINGVLHSVPMLTLNSEVFD